MKFSKSRFHIDFGPDILFERVREIMSGERTLRTNATHFNLRFKERNMSENIEEEISKFDAEKWDLIIAEVINDSGKFINSTWEKYIDGRKIWIVIGFNDTIETIIVKNGRGDGDDIVKEGEIYDFVENVNEKLVKED